MNYWKTFASFCRDELATGGPDPQLSLLKQLSRNQPLQERIWLIGCYGAHHCVPSAYAVWVHWRPDEVKRKSLKSWLEDHWKALPVRPEMRSHRMVDKRTDCLMDFARLANSYNPKKFRSYDYAWYKTQEEVKYFGRYMAIKVLEMFHRFGEMEHSLPDMRAKGGWSPRKCLAMLWPDYPILAERKNETEKALRLVERIFAKTRKRLRKKEVSVSNFQLQVLLCEYKEALAGGYYPGASHDEELMYLDLVSQKFGSRVIKSVLKARACVFPHSCLGEKGGWSGPRKEMFTPYKRKNA